MYHNIQDILKTARKETILNSLSKHKPLSKGNARSLRLANGERDGKAHTNTWRKVETLQFLRVDKIAHVYDEFKKKGLVYVEAYTYNDKYQDKEDQLNPEEFPDMLGLWRDTDNNVDILIEILSGYEIGFEFYDTTYNT